MEFNFKNIVNAISNTFTQFDTDEPLISTETAYLLQNKEKKEELLSFIKSDKRSIIIKFEGVNYFYSKD